MLLPASQPGAEQFFVQHLVVNPHVGQQPAVLVETLGIELQPHGAAGDELAREFGGLRPPRLDRMIWLDRLGRVDPHQSQTLMVFHEQRVTIDDAIDVIHPFVEIGRLDGRHSRARLQQRHQRKRHRNKRAARQAVVHPSIHSELLSFGRVTGEAS